MNRIGIIGAGSIGNAFALLFADAGYHVRVFDRDPTAAERSEEVVADRVLQLHRYDLIQSDHERISRLVEYVPTVAEAVDEALLVQEAGPEDIAQKSQIFADLTAETSADTILASSSSAIPTSRFVPHESAERTLIAHPGNPPYLLRVIEIVGNSATSKEVLSRAESIYAKARLTPVRIRQEIEGFVFNRLQGAVLREAYALIRDGIVDPDGLDALVRDGLGLRWAVLGPFAASDLNVRGGIRAHAQRMGGAYQRMGADRGQSDVWTEEMITEVEMARRREVPLSSWDEAVADRDLQLMQLLKSRQSSRRRADK